MQGYGARTYGDRIAEVYDGLYEALDTDAAVEALVGLARGGRVLELAVGTGRLALPLAARGLEVHGVDASEEMVAKLRAKPDADRVTVVFGDFVDPPVEAPFSLVFVAFNTFFALRTQEEQLRCISNVAALLGSGGVFALEAFVPDLTRFDREQRVQTTRVELEEVWLDVSSHDPVGQRVTSQHVRLREDGIRFYPVDLRYVWPPELDLMARLAGLRLRERWGGWGGEAFDATSVRHVSVYEPA